MNQTEIGINTFEQHVLVLPTTTLYRLLENKERGGDMMCLYTFYCLTAKRQQTNSIYATDKFAMVALGWGRARVEKARKLLREMGAISNKATRDKDTGKIDKHYLIINYFELNHHTTDLQLVDFTTSGKTATNAVNKNINAVNKNINASEVWDFYIKTTGSKEKLTDKRKTHINARLKEFEASQLKDAIKTAWSTPFYQGKNSRGWKLNADYMFRSYEIIEKFLVDEPEKPLTLTDIEKIEDPLLRFSLSKTL